MSHLRTSSRLLVLRGLLIATVSLWLACGDDAGDGPNEQAPDGGEPADRDGGVPDAGGAADGGGPGSVAEKNIDANAGGVLKSPDGVLSLTIPAGALGKDTMMSVRILTEDEWPEAVADTKPRGHVYRIEPSGTKFSEPVTVVFAYGSDEAGQAGEARMKSADGPVQTLDDSLVQVDTDGSVWVTGTTTHLTDFWSVKYPAEKELFDDPRGKLPDHELPVGDDWTLEDVEFGTSIEGETQYGFELLCMKKSVCRVAEPAWGEVENRVVFASVPSVTSSRMSPPMDADGVLPPIMLGAPARFECVGVGKSAYMIMLLSQHPCADNPYLLCGRRVIRSGAVTCTNEDGTPPEDPEAAEAVLGTTQPMTRSGDVLVNAGPTSVVTSFVHPNDTALMHYRALATGDTRTVIWEGVEDFVSWSSSAPSTVTVESATQEITFTRNGDDVFVQSGADGSQPAFGDETDQVTWSSTNTPVASVSTAAPNRGATVKVGDTPADAKIEVTVVPGEVNEVILVSGELTGSAASGASGFRSVVDLADLQPSGGKYTVDLLPSALRDELMDAGLSISTLRVGLATRATSMDFFPAQAPMTFYAANFIQFPGSALYAPVVGSADVAQCSAFPHSFEGGPTISPNTTGVVLCIKSDGTCFGTNDTYDEGASSQCPYMSSALVLSVNSSGPEFVNGDLTSWDIIWSSTGSIGGMTPTGGADWVIVERASDGARRKVEFQLEAAGYQLNSVTVDTSPLPSVGARHPCNNGSHSFGEQSNPDAPYARLCLNDYLANGHCSVIGDAAATPQDDACNGYSSSYVLDFGYSSYLGEPYLDGQGQWNVIASDRGCVESGTLLALPTDGTDVTAVIERSSDNIQYQVVFDWNGTQFAVHSATPTSGASPSTGADCPTPTVLECSALPGMFPEPIDGYYGGAAAVVCIDETTCRVSNDVAQNDPIASTQCDGNAGARALELSPDWDQVCANGIDFQLIWASNAAPSNNCATAEGLGTDAVIVERLGDGARYRIDYAFDTQNDNVTVMDVVLFEDPLPTVGEMYDCAGAPLSFAEPASTSIETPYVSVCIDSTTKLCTLHGDIDSTSQVEACNAADYLLRLGYSTTTGGAYALTSGASNYTIASSSHGTLAGDNRRVDDLPTDGTDISVLMDSVYPTASDYLVVFDWNSTSFTVQSVTAQ